MEDVTFQHSLFLLVEAMTQMWSDGKRSVLAERAIWLPGDLGISILVFDSCLRVYCAEFLHLIWPWHQLFNALGLMNVVRHVKEYRLQILEDTQVVKFRCLRRAVDDCTGFGTGRCIVEVEVFTPHGIRSCATALGEVVWNRNVTVPGAGGARPLEVISLLLFFF